MDTEEKIRERVREMKLYYTNLVVYGFVSALCLLIWIATGGGHFWPIWVFLGLGASAALQGARLGQMKVLEDYFPFLKSDWEEEQIRHLTKNSDERTSTKSKSK